MAIERFLGKVALCVGATQGIGYASARRLAQEGCKVVVNSRRQENVDEAVDSLRKEGFEASGVAGNMRIREDRTSMIKHTCDKYGGIDGLFLSAGVNPHYGNLLTATESEFDRTFDTNLKANFQFVQEIVPVFEKRGKGAIVTNSTGGIYGVGMAVAAKPILLYTVSKTALAGMTQHLSKPLFQKNIRINCVAPGAIPSKFMEGAMTDAGFAEYFHAIGIKPTDPAARPGTPDEIGSIVAFLLSDDSSFMTGNILIASGGCGLNRSL